jgi:hypothetical protein
MKLRILVVTPCYYDVQSFLELQKHIKSVISDAYPESDLITVLVDDTGGQDQSIRALGSLTRLAVVSPPFNLGHQGALVFALRALSPFLKDEDVVVTLDSDGEDSPKDITTLINKLLDNPDNLQLVSIAQRTKRERSLAFNTLYFFFKIFFVTLTGTVVSNGNFMAYRGWFVKNVLFHPFFDYCYSSTVLALAKTRTSVPLARGRRYFGESKMTMISLIGHGFKMLLPFTDKIAVRAVVTASLLFVLTLVAAWYAIYALYAGLPYAAVMITLAVSSYSALAVLLGPGALLFNIFNQTMAIALRELTLREKQTESIKLYGLEF